MRSADLNDTAAGDRYEGWRRALRVALNQEWPQLARLRRRWRRLDSRPIPPRAAGPAPAVVATVAADGGENRLILDPMRIQVVRVADSEGVVYFEECIPHSLEAPDVLRFFFQSNARVQRLVAYLDLTWKDLLPQNEYQTAHLLAMLREFLEWAAILRLACGRGPRLILRDGLLRSVLLPTPVFEAFRRRLEEAVRKNRHRLAGVAKRSSVIGYLSMAFALEESFPKSEPRYARIPPDVERAAGPAAYRWGAERAMGELYAARLDVGAESPILPVDIAAVCAAEAPAILRQLADDARGSFPRRGYPMALMLAHERACLSRIETEALQAIFLEEMARLDEDATAAARDALIEGREFWEEAGE